MTCFPLSRLSLFGLLLALLFVVFATAEDSDVVELTTANFASTLKENDHVFVEFYAPWCGHCKQLVPIYEQVATQMKGKVVVAKVDATKETSLAQHFGIQGFPTLILFSQPERRTNYNGQRTVEALISFLEKKTGPVATVLSTKDEVDNFLSEPKSVVFFGSNPDAIKEYHVVAEFIEDVKFGEVSNADVVNQFGENTIHLNSAEGKKLTLNVDNSFSNQTLIKWVLFEAYPLVREITPDLFTKLQLSGSAFALFFINATETDQKDKFLPILNEWAEPLKSLVHLTWAPTHLFGPVLPRFGASGKVVPTIIGFSPKNKKPVAWDETKELTSESGLAWLKEVAAGTAKSFRKSQPVPENNDGPVKVVVGSSFEDIVLDINKDVLLEIYATWCGHCQALEPVYYKLGELYSDVDHVVIAKIEGTENGLPEDVSYSGFPTLLFFSALNKRAPTPYEGPRTLKGLAQFIEQHSFKATGVDISTIPEEAGHPDADVEDETQGDSPASEEDDDDEDENDQEDEEDDDDDDVDADIPEKDEL